MPATSNYLVLLLFFFNCYYREVNTCSKFRKDSRPQSEFYLVQPSPVQFIDEPQDLVFFHGDTISLYCETNCVQLQLTNTTCAVGFLYNGLSLDYFEPYKNTLSNAREIGRRSLTIHNANHRVSGRYQCFTYSPRFGRLPLTDRVIGRPIHLQMAVLEPFDEEIQRMNVSKGGSLELPCMKGVFPGPSNISWWRNKGDPVQFLDNTEILPNGNLVLKNVTAHMSGDYFYCKIGWNGQMSYNATYQIFVDNSIRNFSKTMMPTLNLGSPVVVALNASVDYISEGTAIYYKSDLLVDLKNVDDYLINVTVTCTFSGHPRPQVKWFLNGLNVSECIDTTDIVIVGNKSILYLSTTNPKSFFGSYQCVVENEVGYTSNTTRILPKGWSNPPEILSVTFQNSNITLRWKSPEYTGGETIQYYRIGFQNFYQRYGKTYLDNQTSLTSYTFGDIEKHTVNGKFYVQFTIEAMNANAVSISDVSSIRLDSLSNDIYPEINDIDCRGRNVMVKWTNHNQTVHTRIWDHCVFFNCSTPGGTATGETCIPASRRSHLKLQHKLTVDDVPLTGTCSFKVLVFIGGYIYRWSDHKSCIRNLSSDVTSKVMDQVSIKKDRVHLTCQATGDPFPTISWYFNDTLVNKSDKYQISTKLLNYTTSTSTLSVKRVESSDVGNYTCYATNGASNATDYRVISVNATVEKQSLMQKKKRKLLTSLEEQTMM